MIRLPGIGVMEFAWPSMLWLLLVLPALVALYVRGRARRGVARDQLRGLEMLGDARGAGGAARRHLPALLWLVGIAAMLVAVARPQASLVLPSHVEAVMLAIDISGSMRATDVEPNRLAAAREAAKAFLAGQPRNVRVGVVAIAGSAAVVQSPTTERQPVIDALDRLQPQRGTALGNGLVIALAALLPGAGIDVDRFIAGRPALSPRADEARGEASAPAPGSNDSAAVVLLSDGQSNTGPDPMKAAEIAAATGVRVFTVGVGTPEGARVSANGMTMRVRLDETALRKIADASAGEYHRAADAESLKRIYRYIGTRLAFERQRATEVSALFAAVGALLAVLGALLSLRWFNRIL